MSLSALLLLIFAAALLAVGCGTGASGATTTAGAGTSTLNTVNGHIVRQGPVTQDAVKQIISHELGDKGEMGEALVRNVALTPEAGGTFVQIDINRTDCPMIGMHMVCTANQLPGVAATMTRGVMSVLFEYSDVSRVQINLYSDLATMIDMNSTGSMNEKLLVKTMFTRDAAAKIDWASYSQDNAAKLASSYWVDPAVLAANPGTSSGSAAGGTGAPAAAPSAPPATPPAGAGAGSSTGASGGSMPGMPGM
jgi:hypothetical protein